MKHIKLLEEFFNTSNILEESRDEQMVNGIIDLLLKVKDLENRKEMAMDVIDDFEAEGVAYDKQDFLNKIKIEA